MVVLQRLTRDEPCVVDRLPRFHPCSTCGAINPHRCDRRFGWRPCLIDARRLDPGSKGKRESRMCEVLRAVVPARMAFRHWMCPKRSCTRPKVGGAL